MKLVFSVQEADFNEASKEIKQQINAAAKGAVDDAAKLAVQQGRANIASAGFPAKWQSAFGYAPNKGSKNPEAVIFHRIGLASVFETGMTISGKPLLWLPIEKNVPRGQKLVSVNVAGRRPLLFDAANRQRGPLFVGVPAVTIRKRFDLRRIIAEAAGHMGEFYQKRVDEAQK